MVLIGAGDGFGTTVDRVEVEAELPLYFWNSSS